MEGRLLEELSSSPLRLDEEPGLRELFIEAAGSFKDALLRYDQLLKAFWDAHDPTQGMRQGNDGGTQYRSGIYYFSEAQKRAAEASKAAYEKALMKAKGLGPITTEILPAPEFYFAEGYHQQYLAKNPHGYCGLGGTGVSCPIGTGVGA